MTRWLSATINSDDQHFFFVRIPKQCFYQGKFISHKPQSNSPRQRERQKQPATTIENFPSSESLIAVVFIYYKYDTDIDTQLHVSINCNSIGIILYSIGKGTGRVRNNQQKILKFIYYKNNTLSLYLSEPLVIFVFIEDH